MQFTPFLTFPLRTGSLLLAMLLSASVLAAELGDTSVRSYIGQQLSADIELVALTPDDLAGLQVKLAQPNVYQGANITMNPALAGVRLTVVKRDQRQFLHITTFQPIEADYLHLYLELNAGGRHEVRLATLWLQPDPHPAPPPAPVPAQSDAALVAARARASQPQPKPRAPLAEVAHDEGAAPAGHRSLGPKDLAAAIAARLPSAKAAAVPSAPDPAAPVLALATRPPPLKGMAAPAACAAQPAGMAARECAALDAHNAVLTSKLGELEGKLKALQLVLEGKAPATVAEPAAEPAAPALPSAAAAVKAASAEGASASASAEAASAPAAASASASAAVPTKMVKVLPKLKHKKDKPPEQGVSTAMLAAAGAGLAAVLGGLGWWWLRRRKAKGAAPLKIWQGWRKKKAPEATPEPAPPLSEVTPESLL